MAKIIDADGHIVEPRTFWQDYIDPRFRDRLPRIVKDSTGIDRIAVGDKIPTNSVYAPAAMCIPGGLAAPELMRKLSWDDLRPGSYDPHARLQDMDSEGIDVSVLFPSIGIGFVAARSAASAASTNGLSRLRASPFSDAAPARASSAASACITFARCWSKSRS